MHKLMSTLVSGSLALVTGCLSVDEGFTDGAGTVVGNDFRCTGEFPNPHLHPCNGIPFTVAESNEPGVVNLTLFATTPLGPWPTETTGSHVFIDLRFDDASRRDPRTSAHEITFLGTGSVLVVETSQPTSASIRPIVVSPTPEGRNAGKFSLTFEWGGISGTYDTAPVE